MSKTSETAEGMVIPSTVTDASDEFGEICLRVCQTLADTGSEHVDSATLRTLLIDASPASVDLPDLIAPSKTAPVLIVPGLFGDSARVLVGPFARSLPALEAEGYRPSIAWVNGRAGCDANARTLRKHVLEAVESSGEAVHLIGYSKGCADALHLLERFPEVRSCVRSLSSLAGVVLGTPLANDTDFWLNALVRWVPAPGAGFGDGRALDDLDPDYRRSFLARFEMPSVIRYASLAAAPPPRSVSRVLRRSWRKLAAISNESNDSQMIASHSILPAGDYLGRVAVDHWAIALPIAERHPWLSWLVNHNDCPRGILLRALIQFHSLREANLLSD